MVPQHLSDRYFRLEAASGNQWTVRLGGGVGRIMKLDFQPVNILGQFYGNAVHQDGAASWSMRLQIPLLSKFTND